MFTSVRTQLVALFSLITAAAIGFIYLYVVPQLSSSLTAEKLRRLEEDTAEAAGVLRDVIGEERSQDELRQLVLRQSQQAGGARLTLLGVRSEADGPRPTFVIADSDVERVAVVPSYPAAATAATSGGLVSAVERIDGERFGESATAIELDGEPRWVVVLSTPLVDVDDNVDLITRQILIAGLIALGAALAAGYLAARAHARRLRRLEDAAERVARGDFASPIPVDSRDEVGQLATTFNEMRERLRGLDAARKEFVANASHELRTPIFSLGGFMELLDEEDLDPESREQFVEAMREQVNRLTKLTTDLLDLSKLDAEAIDLRAETVDLAALAREVAAEFSPRAQARRQRLDLSGVRRPVRALADPGRVSQILRILIDNAISHTPERTRITLTAKLQQGEPTIAVRDDGPGIEAAVREQVFERFFTGDEAGGSGLGLAIARELARLMGGDLTLGAHQGRTEFVVSLPGASS